MSPNCNSCRWQTYCMQLDYNNMYTISTKFIGQSYIKFKRDADPRKYEFGRTNDYFNYLPFDLDLQCVQQVKEWIDKIYIEQGIAKGSWPKENTDSRRISFPSNLHISGTQLVRPPLRLPLLRHSSSDLEGNCCVLMFKIIIIQWLVQLWNHHKLQLEITLFFLWKAWIYFTNSNYNDFSSNSSGFPSTHYLYYGSHLLVNPRTMLITKRTYPDTQSHLAIY